jgi:hypothetical protein
MALIHQLKPTLLPLRMAMLLLLEIAHNFTVVATKKELFLLRMVLLLLLEMTGNGATAAAKNGIAFARDTAVAAAKDGWQWCYCSC